MFAKIGPIVALAIVLALAIAFVARYSAAEARGFCLFCAAPAHHAARHVQKEDDPTPAVTPETAPARPFDPNFCLGVIKAFDTLHPKDLDTFIFSIPEGKREQARRCMTDRK